MNKVYQATAPANIALIKYMGKQDPDHNLPSNPSLSYTLSRFNTTVKLWPIAAEDSMWLPLETTDPVLLNEAQQSRFLGHLIRIKQYFGYPGHFKVASGNNFPHSVGIASSASSFAALTLCAASALSDLMQKALPTTDCLAQWARLGSGSACRSFYAPWCLWENTVAQPIDLPFSLLYHQVIITDSETKSISSSEAHRRVSSSPHYLERSQRAIRRLEQLLSAMVKQDWSMMFQVIWDEFIDLHRLFETATPAFSYMTSPVRIVLNQLKTFWRRHGDGPLVTMDAGSTIHLLYRLDQDQCMQKIRNMVAEYTHSISNCNAAQTAETKGVYFERT